MKANHGIMHTDGKWCGDLHCAKCYGADTWQKAERDRLRAVNAELLEALKSAVTDVIASNPRCVRIHAYNSVLAKAKA